MVELVVYHEDVVRNGEPLPVYKFETIYRINIVGGDSGTGKTRMFESIELALALQDGWYLECNKQIILVNNILEFEARVQNEEGSVFICDEDIVQAILKRGLLRSVQKSKNYFVFIGRSLEVFIDTNVKALFCLRGCGVVEGVERCEVLPVVGLSDGSSDCADDFYLMVVEDTASGRQFFEQMLNKLKIFGESGGKSRVPENLEAALSTSRKRVLVALDYDCGLVEVLKIIRNDQIDRARVALVNMECFEEVICNTEFILQKFPKLRGLVLGYTRYLDTSYKHTGKYFSKLLRDHVRVGGVPFYSKGMLNFEKCFLQDCKGCGEHCSMFTTDTKKKLLLCNKFECLQKFCGEEVC